MLDISSVLNSSVERMSLECTVDLSDINIYGEHLFSEPVLLKLSLYNRASVCKLDAEYEYTLKLNCSRCLSESSEKNVYKAKHTVVGKINQERDDILVAERGMLDEISMTIDDLLEQIPSRYVCSEDCIGLCMKCGANLNLSDCGCEDSDSF